MGSPLFFLTHLEMITSLRVDDYISSRDMCVEVQSQNIFAIFIQKEGELFSNLMKCIDQLDIRR